MEQRSPAHVAFGLAIRDRRGELDISQEDLASRVGIHRTYIGGIERGERNPSLTNIIAIARSLDLAPSALLKRAERLGPVA